MRSFNSRSFQGIIESDDEETKWDTVDGEVYERYVPTSQAQLGLTEKKQRENFMTDSKISLPQSEVRAIMTKSVPAEFTFTSPAITLSCLAGKLFTAELITLARTMSQNSEPLTPDLICLAFQELEASRKIPGRGNGNIRRI